MGVTMRVAIDEVNWPRSMLVGSASGAAADFAVLSAAGGPDCFVSVTAGLVSGCFAVAAAAAAFAAWSSFNSLRLVFANSFAGSRSMTFWKSAIAFSALPTLSYRFARAKNTGLSFGLIVAATSKSIKAWS